MLFKVTCFVIVQLTQLDCYSLLKINYSFLNHDEFMSVLTLKSYNFFVLYFTENEEHEAKVTALNRYSMAANIPE